MLTWMTTQRARYVPCPACKALNMTCRRDCYRCRRPLPTPLGLAEESVNQTMPLNAPLERRLAANVRRYPRRDVHIPDVILEGEDVIRHRVTIRNISAGGLQFYTMLSCRVGSEVRLHLPQRGPSHAIVGVIRYVSPFEDRGERYYAHGIEFITPSPMLFRLMGNRSAIT